MRDSLIDRTQKNPVLQLRKTGFLLSTAKERYTRHVSCSAGKQMPNVSTSAISGSATMRVDKVTRKIRPMSQKRYGGRGVKTSKQIAPTTSIETNPQRSPTVL